MLSEKPTIRLAFLWALPALFPFPPLLCCFNVKINCPFRRVEMELRQLRYFVRIVETGSMGSAALDLNIGVSALSQQMSRLENELAIRLLQRTSRGVTPTSAGLAFTPRRSWRRHADDAILAAREAGFPGTSASAWLPVPLPFSVCLLFTPCGKAIAMSACMWWKASLVIWNG
jgi:hypothetical protein